MEAAWPGKSAVDAGFLEGRRFAADFRLLGELLDHHVALQLRQEVDEQLAFEMVDLVLQDDGEHAVGRDLLRLAVAIEKGDAHLGRPLDLGEIFGNRQAALLGGGNIVGAPQDLGVDQEERIGLRPASPSSRVATSMVTTRRGTPTWMAASPMPGASYMVSSMESMNLRRSSSTRSTGSLVMRSLRSGRVMISSFATRLRYERNRARVNAFEGKPMTGKRKTADAAQAEAQSGRPGAQLAVVPREGGGAPERPDQARRRPKHPKRLTDDEAEE